LVQSKCIPAALKGCDVIGCSKTGSGKTLAFAIPILQALSEDPYGIFSLILTPTRELAVQISDQFRAVGKPLNLRDCVVVGGRDMVMQGKDLSKKPHIVIATPGRLADHLESCDTFSLKKIKFLVLDEADRLVDGGFDGQLKTIFSSLPPSEQRQTFYFSATLSDSLQKIKELSVSKGREPFVWQSCVEDQKSDIATVKGLDQRYVLTPNDAKDAYLAQVVRQHYDSEDGEKDLTIIFTRTCKLCQLLAMTLTSLGYPSSALHSMMAQKERALSLAKFRSSQVRILVATDLASRGLDIPDVQLVLNHNVPHVTKDYIHRVGRTARAGRRGVAITLVTPHDVVLIKSGGRNDRC
jgi:ATP-dependent RNA helicase DDX49/DBP8